MVRRSFFFSGQVMNRTPKGKPLKWSELAWLAIWGWIVFFGLWAYNRTLWESLVSMAFGGVVLLLIGCWQWTAAPQPRKWTNKQRAWNRAVFATWLAVTLAVICLHLADRVARGQRPGFSTMPEQPPPDMGAGP